MAKKKKSFAELHRASNAMGAYNRVGNDRLYEEEEEQESRVQPFEKPFSASDNMRHDYLDWKISRAATKEHYGIYYDDEADWVAHRQKRYQENLEELQRLEDEKRRKYQEEQFRRRSGYSGRTSGNDWKHSGAYDSEKKALDDAINQLRTEINRYERGESTQQFSPSGVPIENHEGSKVIDDYYGITRMDDFDDVSSRRYGLKDDRLRRYLSMTQEEKDLLSNIPTADTPKSEAEGYREKYNLSIEGEEGKWDLLDDREKGIYYYLFNTKGKDSADKYLDDMFTELNRRSVEKKSAEQAERFENAGGLERVGMSLQSIPETIVGGVMGFADDVARTALYGETNPYSGMHNLRRQGMQTREMQADAFNEATGNIAIPFIDFTVGDAYQALMSTADMAAAIPLGPGVYGAAMGMGAATDEATELYKQGASSEQIALGATLAGAAEMVFERYSIDKLIHMKTPETRLDLIKNILAQGGVEGSEEVFTEVANILSNALVMGSESDWENDLRANNGDLFKTFLDKAKDVARAGVAGALSGGIASGAYSGTQYAGTQSDLKRTGQQIMETEGANDRLLAMAEEMAASASSKTQSRISALSEKVKAEQPSAKDVGRLYSAVGKVDTEVSAAELSAELQEEGFSEKKAKRIAKAYVDRESGAGISDAQETLLKSVESDEKVASAIDRAFSSESTAAKRGTDAAKFVAGVATRTGFDEAGRSKFEASPDVRNMYESADSSSKQGAVDVSKETGDRVEITGIASNKDGVLTFDTASGDTVDASDVKFANKGDAYIYSAITSMDIAPEYGQKLIDSFHRESGPDASVRDAITFAEGIEEAYRFGVLGYSKQEIAKSNYASKINPAQSEYAFSKGAKAAAEAAKAKQMTLDQYRAEARKNKGGRVIRKGNPTVHYEGNMSSLDKKQKVNLRSLQVISEAVGVDIYVFESKTDSKGRHIGENGYFDPKDNSIHIDLFAGEDGSGTMLFTAAHELTHFVKQWSPERFNTLAKFLAEQYAERGMSVDDLVQAQIAKARNSKYNSRELTYDEAMEEFVADSMMSMFNDGKVIDKLVELRKQDRTLFEKIRDFIKDLARKVREFYEGLKPDTVEGRIVAEMSEQMDDIQRMFTDAIIEAGESYSASKQVSDEGKTDRAGKMFSMRDAYEESGDLIAVHNLSEEKLLKSLKLGGLPMPSIAIFKADDGHTDFGEISLVFGKETIDPKSSRANKVYSGDAWTPTYPFIEYKASADVVSKIRVKERELRQKYGADAVRPLQRFVNEPETVLGNLGGEDALLAALYEDEEMMQVYREDAGLGRVKDVIKKIPHKMEPGVTEISKFFVDNLGPDFFAEMNVKDGSSPIERRRKFMQNHESELREAWADYLKHQEHDAFDPETIESIVSQTTTKELLRLALDARSYLKYGDTRIEERTVRGDVRGETDQSAYRKWVDDLFSGISEKEGIRNEKDLFTPSGNRLSFEALHYENTLENVVKAMKKSGDIGIGAFGGGNIFGASVQEYGSIDQIKAAESRLSKMSKEEFDEIKKDFTHRFFEIASSLPINKGSFSANDDAANMLIEAVSKFKTKSGIEGYIRRESDGWARYSQTAVDELIQLVRDIRMMPTKYFEAKPRRAVGFDEVVAVVAPDDLSENARKEIEKNGLHIISYEHGDKVSRLDALNSVENVKFSDRSSDRDYMDAVESGNMDEAQRMVDDAAKRAGYTIKAHHGTTGDFWSFSLKNKGKNGELLGLGYYFAQDRSEAKKYGKRLLDVFLKIDKPVSYNSLTISEQEWSKYMDFVDENRGSYIDGQWKGNRVLKDFELRYFSENESDIDLISNFVGPISGGSYEVAEAMMKMLKDSIGYDGVTYGKNGSNIYVAFTPEQIKSSDPVVRDDSGEVIPLSDRFDQEKNDIRYSDRTGESVSDRALLANAFENLAKYPKEKKLIREYKENLDQLQEETQKRNDLQAEVKDLRETLKKAREAKDAPKVKATKEKIRTIQDSIAKAGARISTYDAKLLRLSAAKPLRDVIAIEEKAAVAKERERGRKAVQKTRENAMERQKARTEKQREKRREAVQKVRERAMERQKERTEQQREMRREAYRKGIKKGDEKLSAYKEKAAKREADLKMKFKGREADLRAKAIKREDALKAKHREQIERGIESRNKTAMRHKIIKVVKTLNDLLLKGDKKHHVMLNLQKTVAAALDVVNMDTVSADTRLAKLQEELSKAKNQKQIDDIMRRIDTVGAQGGRMNDRLMALKAAYDEILKNPDPDMPRLYRQEVSEHIQTVAETVGSTPLRDMSLNQLEMVYDLYKMILHTVSESNKMFKAARYATVSENSNTVMEQVKKTAGVTKMKLPGFDSVSKFFFDDKKPIFAFEFIGSKLFTNLFKSIRSGEDQWAVDISESKKFFNRAAQKYGYWTWDMDKRLPFVSRSGMKFDLSLPEMMSLYAYSKRNQAIPHLENGGFVFDENSRIVKKTKSGLSMTFKPTEATAYNLTREEIAKIAAAMTPEQKKFVDEMQEYLSSDMAAKGNEVSMALYGIKLFGKEKHYFPLKSSHAYMEAVREAREQTKKIVNAGFTHSVVQEAKNPIVLTPFMDAWAGHIDEMSRYHAFTLPLEDFYAVYNYRIPSQDGSADQSVFATIKNAYGSKATSYIDQMLKDINGATRADPRSSLLDRSISLFKKGAVLASASVVIQQPSAIARTLSMIDAKYFVGRKLTEKTVKSQYEELKKYAPVAVIKEMGFFDTSVGQSTVDYIKEQTYDTFAQKAKAVFTDSSYRDNLLSFAPSYADEVTWVAIWDAVKRETAATTKLKVGSEEFLKRAGDRFTDIIVHTQVYDSTLSRSGLMRSKDGLMKSATAFMAEPTTSFNMLTNAILQAKRGNKRGAARSVGAVVASIILNSILASIVYAARDEDEDKTYLEKYTKSVVGNTVDSMNPLAMIPFVRDIISVFQGYDVERADMSVVIDLRDSFKKLSSENVTPYQKVEGFAGAVANIFGLPLKNIMRDVRGMMQAVDTLTSGNKTTAAGLRESALEAFRDEKPKHQRLYEALTSGDKEQIRRVKNEYDDDKAIQSDIRKALAENDPRIRAAAENRIRGNIAGYKFAVREIKAEGVFSQDDIVAAINAEIRKLNKGKEEEATVSNKNQSIFNTSDVFAAADAGDSTTASEARQDIIDVKISNGYDEENAEESFDSAFTSEVKNRFNSGEITADEAASMLDNYTDRTGEEASSRVNYWQFQSEYPDSSITEKALNKYLDEAAPYGISMSVYADYYDRKSGYRKKADIMQIIDSLPISSDQKDALYFANGWAESTLWEAPWH